MADSAQTSAIEAVAAAINRLADAVAALNTSAATDLASASTSAQPVVAKKRNNAQVLMSKELADFTGLPVAEPITRQAASAAVMKYIKDNDLQDHEDRRKIRPNAALTALLGSDAVLNVLNLNSSLKNHFKSV